MRWRPAKRSRAIAFIVAAVLSPLLITAVLVLAFGPRDDGRDLLPGQPRDPAPTSKSFNAAGLPPVATVACPSAAQLLPQPVIGKDALPDLTLECIGAIGSADSVQINRLGGVPTVINLWATWCTSCREEMPAIEKVHLDAAGKVRIIGVNTKDYAEGARITIKNTGVTFASVADPDELLRKAVGTSLMPTTLFISAEGRIVHRKVGPFSDAAGLEDDIAKHLGVRL